MKRTLATALAALVAGALLLVSTGEAHQGHQHKEGVAKFGLRFRTSTMQALSIHMGVLAAEKKGELTLTPADRAAHGAAVRALSGLVVDLFQQDTSARTRSKPEIWTDWDTFAARARDMDVAAETLATATAASDRTASDAAIDAVGKTCSGCHKPFRKPRHRR